MDRRKEKIETKRARIGVNIRIYETRPSGIQNFIFGLFHELVRNYSQFQFIFFSTGKKKIEESATYVVAHNSWILALAKKINPLLVNIFFDNLYVLKLMKNQQLAVFIGSSYILPIIKPRHVKYITVIYDLSYLTYKHNPFKLYLNLVMYMKLVVPFILKRADVVVVPSLFVKNQILKKYHVSESKIIVIYGGFDMYFTAVNDTKKIVSIRTKFGITGDYCFTNATNHERKNIFGLIEAFSQIEKRSQLQLIITGLLPEETIIELRKYISILGLENRVKYLGFVTKEELRVLYSSAKIFVFPSFEEGFGFPVIESASCGCLPICSNTGSLPEIIGNKRLLFNPLEVESIVKKMNEVLSFTQSEYRDELEKVKKHIGQFTWKKTAQEWSVLLTSITK